MCDLSGGFTVGVSSTNQRAHAAARNGVDRDAMFLQPLEDSNVRQAERASALEDQADARSMASYWDLGLVQVLVRRPSTRLRAIAGWSLLRPQILRRHREEQ